MGFLLRRLLAAIPLCLSVLVLVWTLVELRPGDGCDAFISEDMHPSTIAALRARLGCDDPIWLRFVQQVGRAAMLDFGDSLIEHRPVSAVLLEALPNTLVLSGAAMFLGQLLGLGAGLLQALRPRSALDAALSVTTLLFASLPPFALGFLLMLGGGVGLGWFPLSGMQGFMPELLSPTERLLDRLHHLVLPATTLALASAASDARFVRSTLLEVLSQDYVRTARAKGLSERAVVVRHALRNALLPSITLFGLQLPMLISGAVIVESVFAWPGMGQVILRAITQEDVPVILGAFYVFALFVALGGLLTDLLYAWADPRIRLQG